MKQLMIRGGIPLLGEVTVSGFKNAALPVLFATVLTGGVSVIENLPAIRDVHETLTILRAMGAEVSFPSRSAVCINTEGVKPCLAPDESVSSFRASSYLLGAELGRFGRTRAVIPGGCRIGARPLDLHLYALSALGADARLMGGIITAECSALHGGEILFPIPSVGATINAILAAVLAEGETVIRGAAREPHIEELCRFLSQAGANIRGGGSDTVRITGVGSLHGTTYRLMPDMIEAGTFMAACGAAGGSILLHGVELSHLTSVVTPLRGMGISLVEEGEGSLRIEASGGLCGVELEAAPYPAFPTDLHPQLAALGCFASGVTRITDTVFPDRFAYVGELQKMGADIRLFPGGVAVEGGALVGSAVYAHDLRAGAALTVAALGARGRTVIQNAEILERGYERFPEKLSAIGAVLEVS